MEKLLYGILFLTFKDLLEVHGQPLHDDCWRLFMRKDINDFWDRFSGQDCQDIVLSDKTSWQAYLWSSLETFNCD